MSSFMRGHGSRPGPLRTLIPPLTPAVKGLAIACIAVFIVQVIAQWLGPGGLDPAAGLLRWFGLVPAAVWSKGWVWQLVTYIFLHGDPMHLLFNLLALWMFGATLEPDWGAARFVRYFFLTGIGAGVVTVLAAPRGESPTIGASGAIFGIILAFGLLYPDRPVFLYFVFPVKAKWFALGLGALTFFSSWAYTGSGVAHIAHLGGMLFGYAYIRRLWRIGDYLRELRWRIRRRRFRVVKRGGNGDTRYPFH